MKLFKKKPKFTYLNFETDMKILEDFNEKNNPKKETFSICDVCNENIPDSSFQKVHHLFSYGDYECFIERKMSINFSDKSYHWDCFITTEAGKKWEKSLTEKEMYHHPINSNVYKYR